jgi:hypothetical protein
VYSSMVRLLHSPIISAVYFSTGGGRASFLFMSIIRTTVLILIMMLVMDNDGRCSVLELGHDSDA